MQEAYIVAGYRTAVGKSKKGGFRFYRPDDLAVEVIKGLMASVPQLEANRVDDVIVGNAVPEAEQGLQFGRIIAAKALGIEVAFTELDLSVLPNPWDSATADVSATAQGNAKMNPYKNGLPDSVQQTLTKSYTDLFKLFVKYKKDISRVTFWGVNDGQSWLNNWPIPGRTNYPLLFDREFNPKPAFYKVIALKK